MEIWREIRDFPGYSVSSEGRVRNDDLGNHLHIMVNQYGLAHVSLIRHHIQYRRGLAHLVASHFLKHTHRGRRDTPINLNGDRLDCRAVNLQWRSRWFAIEFFKQFHPDYIQWVPEEIINLNDNRVFRNGLDAAMYYGCLEIDIARSIRSPEPVPPMFHRFAIRVTDIQKQE